MQQQEHQPMMGLQLQLQQHQYVEQQNTSPGNIFPIESPLHATFELVAKRNADKEEDKERRRMKRELGPGGLRRKPNMGSPIKPLKSAKHVDYMYGDMNSPLSDSEIADEGGYQFNDITPGLFHKSFGRDMLRRVSQGFCQGFDFRPLPPLSLICVLTPDRRPRAPKLRLSRAARQQCLPRWKQ